jgi:hypothetical protein
MSKPTARPWKTSKDFPFRVYGRDLGAGPNARRIVANCDVPGFPEASEANANLIVRAVNAHDALVAACKLALGRLQNSLLDTSLFDDVKVAVRDALELAEPAA